MYISYISRIVYQDNFENSLDCSGISRNQEVLKSLFGNRAIEVFGLDKEDTLIPSNPLELYMKTKDEYVISPFPERLSD